MDGVAKEYRQCKRCVMDTTSSLISFDEMGICNFCKQYEAELQHIVYRFTPKEHEKRLQSKLDNIKAQGKGKKYDCILGISGGVDSSYLCILAKEWGLRPLVVHFDNGWDSDLAVSNIKNVINKLDFDLYTYVINWDQFKDLQISYFKASVLDIEVPNDQLIFAVLFKVAKEKGIKNIISGNNIFTEQILPNDWAFKRKFDLTNLRNIHKTYGTVSIKDFPTLSLSDRNKYDLMGYKIHTVFEHIQYDHNKIKKVLTEEYDYQFYECKHFESIFTRFYQGYMLPKKWNIDKRKAHLSCLIMAKVITRQIALEELSRPPYDIAKQLQDKEYVIKKWEMSEEEFDKIMQETPIPHERYGFDKTPLYQRIIKKVELLYKYQFLKRLRLLREE
jgi:N-acetyl sugar amidotransferase